MIHPIRLSKYQDVSIWNLPSETSFPLFNYHDDGKFGICKITSDIDPCCTLMGGKATKVFHLWFRGEGTLYSKLEIRAQRLYNLIRKRNPGKKLGEWRYGVGCNLLTTDFYVLLKARYFKMIVQHNK
jgi:hypothetical protein